MRTVIILLLAVASALSAASLSWNGRTDNNWFEASNWTPNQAPAGGDNLTISSGTPSAAVNVNTNGGGSVTINGGDVTWAGRFNSIGTPTGNGSLLITSGSLSVNYGAGSSHAFNIGNATSTGILRQQGGTVSALNSNDEIFLGNGSASANGTYEISGGTLNAGRIYNGDEGTGMFHVIGDTSTINLVGSAGTSYSQNASSALKLDIDSAISPIVATANVVLAGTLEVAFLATPSAGQTFTIMSYGGSLTGTFASVDTMADSPAGPDTVTFSIGYGSGSNDAVVLTVGGTGPPAPTVDAFTASPEAILSGTAVTLSWDVQNWASVRIDPDIGDVTDRTDLSGNGSFTIADGPSVDTTWTLTVTDAMARTAAGEAAVAVVSPDAQPVISEFMADNRFTLDDEDGDSEDWIELYNPNGTAVPLGGYYLTDDPLDLMKWVLSGSVLRVGGRLVVFASGKDRTDPLGPLHTNFRLDRDGGYLALVAPDGLTLVSEFNLYPALPEDVSYGSHEGENVFFSTPTPGDPPVPAGAGLAGPGITNATENPDAQPGPSDPVIVVAEIREMNASVTEVRLYHRSMYAPEASILMRDDGTGNDAAGGDGIFTATIPAAAVPAPGQMLRWRIGASDADGNQSVSPRPVEPGEPAPNYWGTVVADPGIGTELTDLHWFAESTAGIDAKDKSGGACSVYYLGQFYDNVAARTRGWSARLFNPTRLKGDSSKSKYSYTIDFNRGYKFRWREGEERVPEVKLNTTGTDKYYLRNLLAAETYDRTGVAYADELLVRCHRNGVFFSIARLTEDPGDEMLRRNGLDDDGAFYKVGGSSATQSFKNDLSNPATVNPSSFPADADNDDYELQGFRKVTRREETIQDLFEFVSGLNLSGESRRRFVYDDFDLPATINYMATRFGILGDNDSSFKNYYLYRDTNGTSQWRMMPWDCDFSFGYITSADIDTIDGDKEPDNMTYQNRMMRAIYDYPEFREMYWARLRTLMDNTLHSGAAPPEGRWYESRLDFWGAKVAPLVPLDHTVWQYPLQNPGVYSPPVSDGNVPFATMDSRIRSEFLTVRRNFLEAHSQIPPSVPSTPTQIDIAVIEHNPSSGNQDEEYIKLSNPNPFAVDLSGWALTGGISFTIPSGCVLPAGSGLYLTPDLPSFIARSASPTGGQGRFVIGNYSGHLSNFAEAIQLWSPEGTLVSTGTYQSTPSDNQQFLAITEVMYHPEPNGAAEFIELMNISDSVTLDLTNVRFTDGVAFNFTGSAVTVLAPGARVLVVRDTVAFGSVYGTTYDPIIAGEFEMDGALRNSGERLKLEDADNNTITEFVYSDVSPWPSAAGGGGFSLVLIAPAASPDPENPLAWRPSGSIEGNPGSSDATRFSGDPHGDEDHNGLSNLLDYAMGNTLVGDIVQPVPDFETVDVGGVEAVYFTFTIRRNLVADDLLLDVDSTWDLATWTSPAEIGFVALREVLSGDGAALTTYRSLIPVAADKRLFVRARFSLK